LANAYLPQLSQRNQPNSDLTAPPKWLWIYTDLNEFRSGLGSMGMVKVGVWSCTQIPASMLVMQAVNPFKAALP